MEVRPRSLRSMSFSMHDITVPVFCQTLTALGGVLDRATAHCAARGLDPQSLIEARLIADMQPFAFHMAAVNNNSVGAGARLRGEPNAPAEVLRDFPAMKAALVDAIGSLAGVAATDLEGAGEREVILPNPRGDRCFT